MDVPSSGAVNAANTASHESMSARSPLTISSSRPSVRPRKSRRMGSTGSQPMARTSGSARRRYSSANGGPARYAARHRRRIRPVEPASPPRVESLGHAGLQNFAGLETFPNPGVARVEMTSDELAALCPITLQPDMDVATIAYRPMRCASSRSR